MSGARDTIILPSMKKVLRFYLVMCLLAMAGLWLVPGSAFAHPMPNSLVNLRVGESWISGEAHIPRLELETAMGIAAWAETDQQTIQRYLLAHIGASTGARIWQTQIEAISLSKQADDWVGNYEEVVVQFNLIPNTGTDLRTFTLRYDVVLHQVVTHEVVVMLQSYWRNGVDRDDAGYPLGVIAWDVASGRLEPLAVTLAPGSVWTGMWRMCCLGMQHIRDGLDHVLFLLALLLVAPLAAAPNGWMTGGNFRYTLTRFFQISLAFTVGHSLTLLAGALGWVTVAPRVVEVCIALSIAISAIHAIRPLFFRYESVVAGLFGLVHGLAFSSALSAQGLGLGTLLISVFSFNLGLELMQFFLMIGFIPVLLLSRQRFYPMMRMALASVVLVLALGWTAERITDHGNWVTHTLTLWIS